MDENDERDYANDNREEKYRKPVSGFDTNLVLERLELSLKEHADIWRELANN